MEKLQGKNMRDVITTLQERGVQTRAIWGLIHEQLPYQDAIAYEMEKAPYYSSCILNIPSSTQITDDDIRFVVEQIKVVFKSGIWTDQVTFTSICLGQYAVYRVFYKTINVIYKNSPLEV